MGTGKWAVGTWLLLFVWAWGGGGCGLRKAHGPSPAARCAPTGWVDRIESGWAVVDEDGSDEERLYRVECFPAPPRPGTRVVRGRLDRRATLAMRARLRRLLEEAHRADE